MVRPPRKSLPIRALKTLASAFCFSMWGLGASILAWFVLPISRLRMRNATPKERMHRAQEITAAGNGMLVKLMRFCGLVMFNKSGNELDLPDGPYVLIANHPCLIDVCTLTSINPRMCVIAKPKMTRSWFVGRALRAAGHIEAPGKADSAFAGAAVVSAAVERLKQGFPVLFFPEGTRSPPGAIGKFSRGAFEAARRAGVPIACCLISADPPTLHRGMKWHQLPKEGSQYTIQARPPVTIDEVGGNSRAASSHFHEIFTAHVQRKSDRVAEASAEVTQQAGVTP